MTSSSGLGCIQLKPMGKHKTEQNDRDWLMKPPTLSMNGKAHKNVVKLPLMIFFNFQHDNIL